MSDEWYTPKWLFDELGVEFDLDVAHPARDTDVPCKRYYTIDDDSLNQPWEGLVWMNPPYSKPSPWVDKWLDHGNGLALLPMAKSKWFNKLMDSDAYFRLLPSTFKFTSPEGKPISLMMGSMVWGIGEGHEILKQSGLGKLR
jgi:phage N-6-adenine-methyltransferase